MTKPRYFQLKQQGYLSPSSKLLSHHGVITDPHALTVLLGATILTPGLSLDLTLLHPSPEKSSNGAGTIGQ